MTQLVNRFDLFATPVWQYQYNDFQNVRGQLIEHLTRDDVYLTQYEKNGIQTTEGDLHSDPKHEPLIPLRNFMIDCIQDVMVRMGYESDVAITSMWATRQRQGASHHEHIHPNTFLAAVFYLFDADGNANGTSFMSPLTQLKQIQPRRKPGTQEFFPPVEHLPFVPGTCVIFPGWAKHGTFPSPSRYRIMVGVNVMPVGHTNGDHYNQYSFPEQKDIPFLKLDEHRKIGYGTI